MKYDHNQICTTGHEVNVGDKLQYKEDGYVCDVTVLADESNDKEIAFKLRVDALLRWPGGVGEEFSCMAARGHYAYSGMWRLYDLGEYMVFGSGPETVP